MLDLFADQLLLGFVRDLRLILAVKIVGLRIIVSGKVEDGAVEAEADDRRQLQG